MWGFNIGLAKLFEYPMREMAVKKHSLNHNLKQQDKISSSRRISTCSLILKDYFENCAIEITVSHAIAFEEDKTESIGLSVELPDYVSLTILFQTSRLLHRARPQCDLTAVKQLWPLHIPLTRVMPLLTSLSAFWSYSLLWECWGSCWVVLLGFRFLASCDSEAHSSSSGDSMYYNF